MIRLTEDRRKVGGVALGAIWIGNNTDEWKADLEANRIGAILNVAQDMVSMRGWYHNIEAMHVGLIDGPGNEVACYASAVLALHSLLKRHNVLVCCHNGPRSLTVAVMYISITTKGGWFRTIEILQERVEETLPAPRAEHMTAFDRMDWSSLKKLMGEVR